jgi:Holliday junction resolvase RusA-like endonuclease
MIRFTVAGHPIPQGSARAFRQGQRCVVTSDNPKLKNWRGAVAEAALAAVPLGFEPIDGPVEVVIHARMPRQKTVKRDYPTGAKEGDVDKIARAVLDGMTAIIYTDDSRVVRLTIAQDYPEESGEQEGVTVQVLPIERKEGAR